jgi:hypothetical protein
MALVVGAVMASLAGNPASADDTELAPFFGTYVGHSDPADDGEKVKRDLGVSIEPADDDGFRLTWTTVRHKLDGRRKEDKITIDFLPVRRQGIFSSAMRRDKFGHRIPLNPLKGDPYVWARVYAMRIRADGGYEMQVYDRTLVGDGLALVFSRVRDGETLRSITGTLRRTGD